MSSDVINTYDAGVAVRTTITWTIKSTGALVNPDVVRLKYRNPLGTLTTYVHGTGSEVVNAGTGTYYADIVTTDQPGFWLYRWEAETSGSVAQMALEHKFRVMPSKVL